MIRNQKPRGTWHVWTLAALVPVLAATPFTIHESRNENASERTL